MPDPWTPHRSPNCCSSPALRDRLDEEGRSEAVPVDAELCQELDRRWSAHLQNPTAALAWDQVRSQLGLG
jgi:putative addiction module component (TIGR02574 family)